MERKKCQVCGGPVVNGRCKLCGMPYRNDEVLYHLNESRSDHCRHATDEAREILKNLTIPLGDKAPDGSTVKERVRRESEKHIKQTRAGSHTAYNKKKPVKQEESKGKASAVSVGITVLIVLIALLPSVVDRVKEGIFEKNNDTWLSLDEYNAVYGDEDADSYIFEKTEESILTGVDLPEGEYEVSVDGGYGAVSVADGETYYITEGKPVVIELLEGQEFFITNVDSSEREIEFQKK